MAPQLPKVVLPKVEVMSQSPIMGLSEVRTSLSNTLANIEAALPAGGPSLPGGVGQLRLPKIEQIFKGPGAALEEIKSSFEATVSGLAPGQGEGQRGTITEEKPAPSPGGVATRGSL